jgi:hypothetical protein
LLSLSEFDDHLSERGARLHGLEGLAKILERHHLADHGLNFPMQASRTIAAIRRACVSGSRFWICARSTPSRAPPLSKGRLKRQRRNGAGGKPDHEVPPAPGDRAKRLQRHLAADGIEDDVRAVAAGQAFSVSRQSALV